MTKQSQSDHKASTSKHKANTSISPWGRALVQAFVVSVWLSRVLNTTRVHQELLCITIPETKSTIITSTNTCCYFECELHWCMIDLDLALHIAPWIMQFVIPSVGDRVFNHLKPCTYFMIVHSGFTNRSQNDHKHKARPQKQGKPKSQFCTFGV